MRIWISGECEPLPMPSGERLLRYGELARHLAGKGHSVTWFGSDFSHREKTHLAVPGGQMIWAGVTVVLIHGSGYRRNVGLDRLLHFEVHARNLRRFIADQRPPDVIVAGMPSIESSDVMVTYGKHRKIPVVVDIRDEWPEDFIRWLPPAWRPLARFVLLPKFRQLSRACRGATALFGVTDRQLEYGLHYAGRRRCALDAVFHLGASPPAQGARYGAIKADWRARGLTSDKFICVFGGTLSRSRPLKPIIDAVIQLAQCIPIIFVVAGGGDAESAYRRQAEGHPAIQFVGWQDHESLTVLLNLADVLLAPYDPTFGFSLPTKVFEYLAAGKPVVASCLGETQVLIERFKCGVHYGANDATHLRTILKQLFLDSDRRSQMGLRASRLFYSRFAVDAIIARYAQQLEVIGEKSAQANAASTL